MTYRCVVAEPRYRYNPPSITRPQAKRRKLARLLTARRVLHFMGFLAFWAVVLSITYLITVAALAVFILLS